MSNAFKKPNVVQLPEPRTEHEEFGLAKKGLIVSKTCGAYYNKKSWHHDAKKFVADRGGRIPFKFSECPACAMIRHGLYEGKIIISNIPPKFWSEISNLIRAYSKRAEAQDPLDRLIAITKTGMTATITVTENQLAAKLARKIKDVFNRHAKISIAYAKSPSDVSIVRISFQ
jgi:hypothetical protein